MESSELWFERSCRWFWSQWSLGTTDFRCKRQTGVKVNSGKGGVTHGTSEGSDYVYPGYACIISIFHSIWPMVRVTKYFLNDQPPFAAFICLKKKLLTEHIQSLSLRCLKWNSVWGPASKSISIAFHHITTVDGILFQSSDPQSIPFHCKFSRET